MLPESAPIAPVSPPVAVGAIGLGMVIAMFTSGEITTFVTFILAAIMTVLTFRSNAAAAAAREQTVALREATAASVLAAKEAAAAAAASAIELAKIAREDGAAIAEKLNVIHTKTDVIEHATNSAATRDAARIKSQEEQMGMLRETISELRKAAALLAQATASRQPETAPAAVLSATAPTESLKQIDNNTAETASNTARTEAVVQDLKDAQ